MKIVVTGASGKAGRAVVRDLLDHGYDVLGVDLVSPTEAVAPTLVVDLKDLGQTYEALAGSDAVVHLGAIPSGGIRTEEYTFSNNTASTYNVFTAALGLGLKRVVWASSETTLGLPFTTEKLQYAPVDEVSTLYPESSYALSKVLSEEMARQMNRWSGTPFVGLRFTNIMEPHDYARFPGFADDPRQRSWNAWGYVDSRDVAQSCRLGLEADVQGAEVFIIAAADTCMPTPNAELMAAVFPGVPLREGTGPNETLLSIDKARRLLGYAPRYTWRDHV